MVLKRKRKEVSNACFMMLLFVGQWWAALLGCVLGDRLSGHSSVLCFSVFFADAGQERL